MATTKKAAVKKAPVKRAPRPANVTRSDFINTVANLNNRIDRLEELVVKVMWGLVLVFAFAAVGAVSQLL